MDELQSGKGGVRLEVSALAGVDDVPDRGVEVLNQPRCVTGLKFLISPWASDWISSERTFSRLSERTKATTATRSSPRICGNAGM